MLMLGGGVFGARALGPGGQARLAEAGDVTFEKSRVGSKPAKTKFFWIFLDAWPGSAPASIEP